MLRNKGLFSFSNYFTSVPEGGMLVADNCVIDRDGIVEPRRGIADYGAVGADVSKTIQQVHVYKKRILAFLNNELWFDDGSGVFSAFTTNGTTAASVTSQGAYRMKGIEAQGNFFFTSNDGIKKISIKDSTGFNAVAPNIPTIAAAGGVRSPDVSLSIDLNTPAGFLTANSTIAYRILWAYKDNNNNLILGYPSYNAQITNTTNLGYGVKIVAQVPPEIVNAPIGGSYFYQLYRSVVSPTSPASDELNQVYEAPYDGTSTSVTIYDNTPGSIRDSGTPLYTNEYSGQGITQANSPPPLAQDLTLYKNITFYANTQSKQSMSLTMQGTDGFNVLSGVSSVTYAAATSTFNFAANHNMPTGVTHQVVLMHTNATTPTPVVYTAVFPTVNTMTIAGVDLSSLSATASLISVFTSFIDMYYGNPQVSQRFFFVGRASTTALHIGTAKAGMTSLSRFTLNSADNNIKYLFWYKLLTTDVAPTLANASVVAIDLTSASVITASDVAIATANTLNTTGDFYATTLSADVTIATSDAGAVASSTAAFVVSPGAGWTILQTQDGCGEIVASNFIKNSAYISAGQNIESTSKSMVKVISNQVPEVDLFYTSDITALPGSIFVTATKYTTAQFSFISDLLLFRTAPLNATGNMFNPVIGLTTLTTEAFSQSETHLNRLYYSKQYEPESVPDLNYIDVGPQDKAILRVIALRNTLFILKEEAIYSLTGTDSTNFYITLFDSSTLLVAPDTAQVLNNQIYMLSSQGVATITETGVGIISRPLEDVFTRIKNSNFINYNTACFAAAYESDRAYLLFVVSNVADTHATKVYRYNTFTQGWTSWSVSANCAIVNPATGIDKLYLGSSTDNFLEQERKNLSRTDYADEAFALQYVEGTIAGNNIRVSSVSNVAIGDMLVQTQTVSISQFNNLLTKLDMDGGFSPLTLAATYSLHTADNIGTKLFLLTTALHAVYASVAISSGSNVFATVQTDFNNLIATLNTGGAPTHSKDYKLSVGTINQEVLITAFQYYSNIITADVMTPILTGPVTLYKGIPTQIVWAPLAFGDPSLLKHVREGTFMFEYDAISSATVGYATDLSPGFETITFGLEGDGSFGHSQWSGNTWGGIGSSRPFRTLIPRQKQRCRFIKPQFIHSSAFYKFSIIGLSFVYEITSTRGYR